jgi:hypothetical protein
VIFGNKEDFVEITSTDQRIESFRQADKILYPSQLSENIAIPVVFGVRAVNFLIGRIKVGRYFRHFAKRLTFSHGILLLGASKRCLRLEMVSIVYAQFFFSLSSDGIISKRTLEIARYRYSS